MYTVLFLSFVIRKEAASLLPHVPAFYALLYSMLAEQLIVTLTFVKSGKTNFPESLALLE